MKKQIGSKKDSATTIKIRISLWAVFFKLCSSEHYFHWILRDTIWRGGKDSPKISLFLFNNKEQPQKEIKKTIHI